MYLSFAYGHVNCKVYINIDMVDVVMPITDKDIIYARMCQEAIPIS